MDKSNPAKKEFKKDRLIFSIDEEEKTASLIKGDSARGDIIIPRFIKPESQEFLITSIQSSCFKYSTMIKSIKFAPDTELQKIGNAAFPRSTVKHISIPSCVSELQDGWCNGISKFTKVTVMDCEVRNIKNYENKFIIGKSDTKSDKFDILYFASRDIKDVTIPPFIKTISPHAFIYSMVENITISPHLTKICECAFACCYSLRRFEVQENSELKVIDKFAFAGSTIESIIIPSSVSEFNESWCDGMEKLTNITIFENKEHNISYYGDKFIIGKSDFKSDKYDIIIFTRRDVKHVTIPSFTKKISYDAFSYSTLTEITIPSSVTHICSHAFSSCAKLKKVDFAPNSMLKMIDDHAFSYTPIKSMTFPSEVVKIGEDVFNNCTELKLIEVGENTEIVVKQLSKCCGNAILMIPASFKCDVIKV